MAEITIGKIAFSFAIKKGKTSYIVRFSGHIMLYHITRQRENHFFTPFYYLSHQRGLRGSKRAGLFGSRAA